MGLKEMMDVNFRGNIYIVQNGKVLYERENGFADLQNEFLTRYKQNLQVLPQEKYLLQ